MLRRLRRLQHVEPAASSALHMLAIRSGSPGSGTSLADGHIGHIQQPLSDSAC